jgi:SsrA-binding protein
VPGKKSQPKRPAAPPGSASENVKIVCRNRRARERYQIEKTFEAGLVLEGTEVKSLRDGQADLSDSYAIVRGGEALLVDFHIAPYAHGGYVNHNPKRTRKLLMHRPEIDRLIGKMIERGYTLIPLAVYFRKGWAKVELAIAKGKHSEDRREEIKKRDADREARRAKRRDR